MGTVYVSVQFLNFFISFPLPPPPRIFMARVEIKEGRQKMTELEQYLKAE